MIGAYTASESSHTGDVLVSGNTEFVQVGRHCIAHCICVDIGQCCLHVADNSVRPQFVQHAAAVIIQPVHQHFEIRQVQIRSTCIQHDNLAVGVSAGFEPQRCSWPFARRRCHRQFVNRNQPSVDVVVHIESPADIEAGPLTKREILEVDIGSGIDDALVRIGQRQVQVPVSRTKAIALVRL